MAYKPTGNYNDQIVNQSDKAQIAAYQDAYNKAKASGNTAGMNAAHAGAEAIRANYGYSGTADGSGYVSNGKGNTVLPEVVAPKEVYTGSSGESYINQLQDARVASARNAIQSAYDQSMIDLDAQEAKLPQAYNTARNDLSAQHELERMNYNEYAAGQGINTGASSQVRLSQNNAYLKNLADINARQADATAALQLERTKAKLQYQADIKQAILDGDTARAEALYQDWQRQDDNKVNAAMQLAQMQMTAQQANLSRAQSQQQLDMERDDIAYNRALMRAQTLAKESGDFSGYLDPALGYSEDKVRNMNYWWRILNGFEAYGGGSGGGGSSGGGGGRRSGGSGSGRYTPPATETPDSTAALTPNPNGGKASGGGGGKRVGGPSLGQVSYSGDDEAILTWNGKNYGSVNALVSDVNKNKNVTPEQEKRIAASIKKYTGVDVS